jgi:hypothetical protein
MNEIAMTQAQRFSPYVYWAAATLLFVDLVQLWRLFG